MLRPLIVKVGNTYYKTLHYENLSMLYTKKCKNGNGRGGSNEYPHSMFWSKNKKNRYTPAYPSFTI